MGNDELMKKVFNQARKFMKYDSENFHDCVDKHCVTDHKEQDEHTEESLCSVDQELNHSRYVLHAIHCLHCNDVNIPITLFAQCW
jgi:hypothetical protein